MLTYEEQEQTRQERLIEVGNLPPCPLCGVPRVQRSDYVRCNPCGVNWLNGEDLDKDPKIARYRQMVEEQRRSSKNAGKQDISSSSAQE